MQILRSLGVLLGMVGLVGCAQNKPYAPTGSQGSWLVAGNVGAWWSADGNHGGIDEEILTYHAPLPHLLVGGRLAGLTEIRIRLFDDDDSEQAHLVDFGPIVGTGASWWRFAGTVSGGPLLTHVKHHEGGAWQSDWTVGLGLDAGVTFRVFRQISLGAHALQNYNGAESATSLALRFDGSFFP